MKKSIHSIMS